MTGGQERAGAGGLKVSLGPCPTPDLLAFEWQGLEAQARPSFFTSWTWIGAWLDHLRTLPAGHGPALLRVHGGSELVGLGLVVPQVMRRLRWWPSQALHLHATGRAAWDDLTIEHNGLLARTDLTAQVGQAVAMQLWALAPSVDQLRVPGVSAGHERWRGLRAQGSSSGAWDGPANAPDGLPWSHRRKKLNWSPISEVREYTEPAYRVDLTQLRASGQTYLDHLGPPTRAAIRRSLRMYEQRGAVRLEVAATVDEGLHFLSRLKHFHQTAWQARGRPGAFANPGFERFHRELLRNGLPAGHVQLLRVMAGPDEVGYLLNFSHAGQMLAYQSGFHFGLSPRNHHPGLVAHALAVQQALETGFEAYDFLAGQARHKEQLANHRYPMTTFTLHRASLGWRLEQGWRRLQAWRASRSGLAPDRCPEN